MYIYIYIHIHIYTYIYTYIRGRAPRKQVEEAKALIE